MEITHLVTVGCSWTYCQGLENVKENGWPRHLADLLGVPVVNLALPGIGNDAIHRRTYEYFFENLSYNSKPIFVIAWSQSWRREFWTKKYHPSKKTGYNLIALSDPKGPKNPYETAIVDNWSEEDFYRRTIKYRLSMNSLFKAHNIPYIESLFTDIENLETPPVREKFKGAVSYLENSPNKCENFYDVVRSFPKLPCGHEGYESMPYLANYIHSYIKSLYGSLNPISGDYLTLRDFNKNDPSGVYMGDWE
jgi:hypothetical protein